MGPRDGGSATVPMAAPPRPDGHVTQVATGAGFAIAGICHFLARPSLWKAVVVPIFVTLGTTIASLVVLFGLALKPQQQLLSVNAGWPGWLAWIMAVLLVLAEVAIVNLIVMLAFFGCVQSKIFRSVLEEKGVLQQLRLEHGTEELPEAYCFQDFRHSLLFLVGRLPLMLLTLPLHGIPVLGQIAWIMLNGWLYTWELEAEFMVTLEECRGCKQQFGFVRRRLGSFATFGAAALALELIPFLGPWVFFASNACGAAMLAQRIFMETHRFDGSRWCKILPDGTVQPHDALRTTHA